MIRNYLRAALRRLRQNKVHSFVNIAGLSIGMAVTLLIGLWIADECSYEKYNPSYDHIAQVIQHQTLNGSRYATKAVPLPLAAALRSGYGSACPVVVTSLWTQDHILSYGGKRLTRQGKFMEPGAPDLLGLTLLQGTKSGLEDPSSIMLSASAAHALFGSTDPMGRTIKIDDQMTGTVTGVYQDIPANSVFHTALFIAPWDLYASANPWVKEQGNDWGYDAVEVFVRLADNTDAGRLSDAIRDLSLRHLKGNALGLAYQPQLLVHPMSKWRLYSEKSGPNAGGLIRFVWLFGIIGLFVLLLACINFMNLSTARSEHRAREIGIRKTMGSARGQLIGMFLCESLVTAFIAWTLAILLAALALPAFNRLADKSIAIGWASPLFWLAGLCVTLLTGLVAGSYPALYLSSFRPIKVLKGAFKAGPGASIPRKALVIVQFTVAVGLIIGTLVVFRQIEYARQRPVGYSREGLLTLPMNTHELFSRKELLRNQLLGTGAVTAVAESSSPATLMALSLSGFEWRGKDPNTLGEFGIVSVSHGYGTTMGWQMLEGRDFSRSLATDSSALVINEAAARFMNLRHPVGETVTWDGKRYLITGVIRNMLMESPYEPTRPTVFYLGAASDARWLFVRLNPSVATADALHKIQAVFHKIIPSSPFDYKFVADEYGKKFATEQRIGRLGGLFTILAIFISCLGIYAMALFTAEQRTKELGVRKVLGASVFSLWKLLSKEFVLLVGISIAIAAPVAALLLHRWLGTYTYHSGMPWWIFVVTGAGALLVTLLTISLQSIKAAMANPVKSLRSV